MKSLKKFFALCLTLALALSLAACAQKPAETTDPAETPDTPEQEVEAPVTARIAALKGPTAMGLVKLMSDAPSSANGPLYDITLAGSADEVTPALIKGELDMACVPANLAAVLYNKTEGAVQVLAVNTLGVLYIVENGESVQSLADLKGKTVVAAGKGSTPEYALRYLLTENGSEFVEAHPAAVGSFLTAYAASVDWVNANTADAAVLIGEYGIVDAAVAEKALPYCNIVCITGAELLEKLPGYLSVLYNADPAAVGGAMPDNSFYFA